MSLLNHDQLMSLMGEVQMAPSAHNTQPGYWTYSEGEFVLHWDSSRDLPVADASHHDRDLSLGAQIEGLSLSLSRYGLVISAIKPESSQYQIKITQAADLQTDPLLKRVTKRRTYRGVYKKATVEQLQVIDDHYSGREDIQIIKQRSTINKIAKLYDHTTQLFFNDSSYTKELYHWLRFSKKHKDWSTDGLNAESMALTPYEAFFGQYIMRPNIYETLNKIGLGPLLIAEAGKVKTSSFIFCIMKKKTDDDQIALGRLFYRQWLEIDALGFNICPLSNIVDHPVGQKQIQSLVSVPEGYELFKIFRAGPHPKAEKLPRAFRLNLQDFFTYKEPING